VLSPARSQLQKAFEDVSRDSQVSVSSLLASFPVAQVDYAIQVFKVPCRRVPGHVQDFSDLTDAQEIAAKLYANLIDDGAEPLRCRGHALAAGRAKY
jgi:ABC-type sulfate transport system substrate-binding protein